MKALMLGLAPEGQDKLLVWQRTSTASQGNVTGAEAKAREEAEDCGVPTKRPSQ